MARIEFPADFRWGAATAAYQIEGAAREDGRGESIWDRFAHTPGRVLNGDTGDRACDSYHRFAEDVALLRRMNLRSYRFSIAWPRIQPDGMGAPLQKGLDHYGRFVDALLEADIRPLPTLYHWDLPQALEERGGWPERDTAWRFADYAHAVMCRLGDRVADWVIFNEPGVFVMLGYALGQHAPGRRDVEAALRASHTVHLAQAEAFRAMKDERGDARIGTAVNLSPVEPEGDQEADAEAARRYHAFTNDWYLRPALEGRYPDAFQGELPEKTMGIREGDLARIQVPLDFIGINLYTRTVTRRNEADRTGPGAVPIGMGGRDGARTHLDWEVWPRALRDAVAWVTDEYDAPEIEITENGCAWNAGPDEDGVVRDVFRIDFHRRYLAALHEAIEDGANVVAYHAWSLLDNFEWAEGYSQRFGLAWVDFETGERTLKQSGEWYGGVASDNGLDTEAEGTAVS